MDRRYDPSPRKSVDELRRTARSAISAFSTPDGRWALVSTSVTAFIAGAVAWLAMGTMPPSAQGLDRESKFLPYQLFMQLAHNDGAAYASFGPDAGNAKAHNNVLEDALDQAVDEDTTPGIDSRTVTLEPGDTLVGALVDAGVSQEDASAAVNAMAEVFNPRDLRAGETFGITFATGPVEKPKPSQKSVVSVNGKPVYVSDDDGGAIEGDATETPIARLLTMHFSPSIERDIHVMRGTDNSFAAQDIQKKLSAKNHRAGATIDSSLYLAAMQAGIPADVVVNMIKIFSYEVDFQRDIRPGDSFEVLYNYYYTPEGEPAKPGDIAYAVMKLGGRTIALYRYQPDPNEPAEYFNAQGQSSKSMLMKTPVDGARISSGFGMRFHPVLGYSRMHKGIDFAVPIGTPVMAAGGGTVVIAGRTSGYGNYVKISHQSGYSTAYGHLSRLAPGIRKGSHVRQGQIVAYSGNTGMSTGPHLHYEIIVNGAQVNPKKVKVAAGRKLQGKERKDFLAARGQTDTQLAAMPLETKVADMSNDLRDAKSR